MRTPLVLLALTLPLIAHAQPRYHERMMEGGPRMMWDADEACMMGGGPYLHGYPWRMNLTEAQRAEADKIFDQARTRQRANREQMVAAQAKLREAMNKPKRDRDEIMNAWREIERIRARDFETNLDAQLEFDRLQAK